MSGHRGKVISNADFRRLWLDESLTTIEIGKLLGISQEAVCERARARRFPPRRMGPPSLIRDKDIFRAMWDAGVSVADISAHFGVAERTARDMRRSLGIPRRAGGKHTTITLRDFLQARLAERMAEAARIEQAALRNAEMWDDMRTKKRAA